MLSNISGPAGCPRGHIPHTDSILNIKARKFVEICDGPIYPDFEKPPAAVLFGEETLYFANRYAGVLEHWDTHHLEQLAAIHGLYYLTLADSEDCRLDLINSQHLGGIQLIDGECRPGLVAVQGALASALDRNWTNLALCITRTPPFGGRSDVEKFAEENGGAGLTPDQHHPKYFEIMQCGPVGLLSRICVSGGAHPCIDRLLDNPRCLDLLERLLSFISRCPEVLTTDQEDTVKQAKRNPCFSLACVSFAILSGICEHTKKGRVMVVNAVKESQRLDSSTKKVF